MIGYYIFFIGLLYFSYAIQQEENIKLVFNNLENYLMEISIPYLELFLKYSSQEEIILEEKEEEKKEEIKEEKKFENNYVEEFKKLTNDFYFTEEELLFEKQTYDNLVEKLLSTNEKEKKILINKLHNLRTILDKGEVNGNDDIRRIINYHNLEIIEDDDDDDDDEQETYNLNAYFLQLLDRETEYNNELKKLEEYKLNYEELKVEAHKLLVKKHLEQLFNNYIIEHTPLGNIIMRYNEAKGSFEYFSNNTIPYRYLESVGRKYVITYRCKSLFIDLEEELKKAEEKKNLKEDVKNVSNKYNKESNRIMLKNNMQMKNRVENKIILPPQIKSKLIEISSNEKHLLKENANRYTWEGRLSSFNPLKKIDRKIVDKKYGLTYADFKRMQLTNQNKK
jgi:hypothetical protein